MPQGVYRMPAMHDLASLQWPHTHFLSWNTHSYQYHTKAALTLAQ
jgi:hypothetical protein